MSRLWSVPILLSAALIASEPTPVLWRDPGAVETLDLAAGPLGPGGAPQGPFSFQEEEGGGTSAKILVRDATKRVWSVKWGPEVKSETFASKIVWATGYMVEADYFVASGNIESVGAVKRAREFIDSAGNFKDARFELRDPHYYPVRGQNWTFREGVGEGSQFAAYKVLLILLSNWDIKDAASGDPDPNTSVMKREMPDGSFQLEYIVNDWGATMGRWGNIATRSKWDCKGYTEQSGDFVTGVDNGFVKFGYSGKEKSDMRKDIRVEDVRWLLQYVGRITDAQVQDALRSSGANSEEVTCFSKAFRSRVDQLRRLAS